MVLKKAEGRWLIVEIGRVETTEQIEPIDFEIVSEDSAALWEGMQQTMQTGTPGERNVKVVTTYVNGEVVEQHAQPGDVLREPVAEVVAVGIKPRGTDKTVTAEWKYVNMRFNVTRIEKHGGSPKVHLTITNVGSPRVPRRLSYLGTKFLEAC